MSTLSAAPAGFHGVIDGLLHPKHIHVVRALHAILQQLFGEDRLQLLRYPPSLNDIFESAAMEREMYRL
ncbi:hypothetical protein [[Mycobacterium] crassicus]|uniref:Uncharacterized protein n=1 Tax=[Mycobacterium] crassicus TaxID=2872309 RepID=A0ABU5XFY4_9MYCO|nr:hypothetical protein [Mycolicibacter sp. MYC098]MEB3021190.1 hypothetical protein [Mycolicibacter sp. MYC098]